MKVNFFFFFFIQFFEFSVIAEEDTQSREMIHSEWVGREGNGPRLLKQACGGK